MFWPGPYKVPFLVPYGSTHQKHLKLGQRVDIQDKCQNIHLKTIIKFHYKF